METGQRKAARGKQQGTDDHMPHAPTDHGRRQWQWSRREPTASPATGAARRADDVGGNLASSFLPAWLMGRVELSWLAVADPRPAGEADTIRGLAYPCRLPSVRRCGGPGQTVNRGKRELGGHGVGRGAMAAQPGTGRWGFFPALDLFPVIL
jgi:hypothetical protein